jgi:glyoxylase-like metal-dependent hydrolase (beta-lactamase superfamily II)
VKQTGLLLSSSSPTIHTYRSGEGALFVNSYLIEGESGVVSIDAPMLVSDARAYRARLDALHKPLAGVLLTHPHPDHYNGLTELVAALDVPILALADVDREIRERDAPKREQWGPVFGDEWPERSTFPSDTVDPGSPVELAGLHFTPIDAGAGESVSETIWRLDGDDAVAFVGDLVYNGTHSYIADGLTREWIESLDRCAGLLDPAATLYIGHGGPVGVDALQRQKSYLMMLREVVGRLARGADHLDDGAADELVRIMGDYTGGAPLAWLLTAGRDAVAAELSREKATA